MGAVELQQPAQETAVDRVAPVLLALLLTLAAGLRLAAIGESLWLDELHTAWTVSGNAEELFWRSSQGNQSSLYFWIIRASVALLGLNEFALRSPSLAAGLCVVWGLYALVSGWSGSKAAGLLAAALAAIDPVFIFYAVEARTYALVQLLALAQVYLFWRSLCEWTWKDRLLLVAVSSVLFYLHYTTCLLLFAETLFILLAVSRRRLGKRLAIRLVVDLLLVGCLCLPALPHILDVAARRDQWKLFVQLPTLGDISSVVAARTYFVPSLLVLALAALHRWRRKSPWPQTRSMPLGLVLCWLLVPVVSAWILTRLDVLRLFQFRYLIISSVTPLVLSAFALAICPGRWFRRAFVAAVLFVAVLHSGLVEIERASASGPERPRLRFNAVSRRHCRNEDWRAAVAWLRDRPVRPLLLRSGLIEVWRWGAEMDQRQREYTTLPVRSIYRLDDQLTDIAPVAPSVALKLSAAPRRQISAAGGAYLLAKERPKNADRIAEWAARQLHCTIAERRNFGNVSAYVLQRRPQPNAR